MHPIWINRAQYDSIKRVRPDCIEQMEKSKSLKVYDFNKLTREEE